MNSYYATLVMTSANVRASVKKSPMLGYRSRPQICAYLLSDSNNEEGADTARIRIRTDDRSH